MVLSYRYQYISHFYLFYYLVIKNNVLYLDVNFFIHDEKGEMVHICLFIGKV